MKLTLEITPVSLGRPRVTARGTYLPKRTQKFREDLQLLVRAAYKGKPKNTPLAVTLNFYKKISPIAQIYGDIDNLVKAVLDACNDILWTDDSLITELHAFKRKGAGKIELEVTECT